MRSVAVYAIAALVLVADQLTKVLATLYVAPAGRAGIQVLGLPLYLTYVTNTGAAFGLFKDLTALFIVIALGVIAAIIYMERRRVAASPWLRVALGLQLGGALGNLLDRLRLGYVVDFIDLRWWPVFNLADSAIVVGVGIVMVTALVPGMSAKGLHTTHERREG